LGACKRLWCADVDVHVARLDYEDSSVKPGDYLRGVVHVREILRPAGREVVNDSDSTHVGQESIHKMAADESGPPITTARRSLIG
jgi:hypothetical protein